MLRRDQLDRAYRLLAGTLILELLWLSWLKADTPAPRPRVEMPPCWSASDLHESGMQ